MTVVDRGFSSEENLRYLARAGGRAGTGSPAKTDEVLLAKAQEALLLALRDRRRTSCT